MPPGRPSCLPTYNERDNLEPLVGALLERLGPGDRVLVIDDNSPDGTGELADRLAAEVPWVSVLHRERKEGIGAAYLAGFRRALATEPSSCCEMDCDFSHDPADVPRLIAAARTEPTSCSAHGTSAGGGTVETGAKCGGSSRAAARCTRGCSSGSECATSPAASSASDGRYSSRSTLPRSPSGYGFQIETPTARCEPASASSSFRSPSSTATWVSSKMSGSIVVEAMLQVPLLRARALAGRL